MNDLRRGADISLERAPLNPRDIYLWSFRGFFKCCQSEAFSILGRTDSRVFYVPGVNSGTCAFLRVHNLEYGGAVVECSGKRWRRSGRRMRLGCQREVPATILY